MKIPSNVKNIMQTLLSNYYDAYLVGGAVRDMLLGKEPHDYDLATDATPDEVESLFDKTIPTGKEYGTITVMVDGEGFEITTYRLESDYDGRRPKAVKFAKTLKEDLSRRDFTINSLAMDIYGNIVDYFDGQRDLANGEINCVGQACDRFAEDKIRALRAIRFGSRYGFKLSEDIEYALYEVDISGLSEERIRDEFNKIIISETPSKWINNLYRYGLMEYIIPELHICYDFDQHNIHHNKNVLDHILTVVDNVEPILELRLSALFHDIGKPATFTLGKDGVGHFYQHHKESSRICRGVMKRLKYSNAEIEYVAELVYWHMFRYDHVRTKNVKKFINKVGIDKLNDLFKLQVADISASKPPYNFESVYKCKFECERVLSEKEPLSLKELVVNGCDMIALGFSGNEIGKVLDYLLEYILEDFNLNTREILLDLALRYFNNLTK